MRLYLQCVGVATVPFPAVKPVTGKHFPPCGPGQWLSLMQPRPAPPEFSLRSARWGRQHRPVSHGRKLSPVCPFTVHPLDVAAQAQGSSEAETPGPKADTISRRPLRLKVCQLPLQTRTLLCWSPCRGRLVRLRPAGRACAPVLCGGGFGALC